MSDVTPETDPKPADDPKATGDPKPEAPEAEDGSQDAGEELGEKGLKALRAERERARELEAKVQAFEAEKAEAEKAKLSEIDRAKAELDEAKKEAEGAKLEVLRFRIAGQHGIGDEEDVELFLTGKDEATLTRQAAKLAERNATPGTPKPDPSSGAKGAKDASPAEQVAAAEKAGDWDAAARLKAAQLGSLANQT